MAEVSVVAVLVAGAGAFVVSGGYYGLFGQHLAPAGAGASHMPAWKVGVELLRGLVVAGVVAGIAAWGEIDGWSGGLALGLVLWVGFPLVLLVGAIVHEGTPMRTAAIHAGDWLIKLLLVATLVGTLQ